jgi:hypothetical protein
LRGELRDFEKQSALLDSQLASQLGDQEKSLANQLTAKERQLEERKRALEEKKRSKQREKERLEDEYQVLLIFLFVVIALTFVALNTIIFFYVGGSGENREQDRGCFAKERKCHFNTQ